MEELFGQLIRENYTKIISCRYNVIKKWEIHDILFFRDIIKAIETHLIGEYDYRDGNIIRAKILNTYDAHQKIRRIISNEYLKLQKQCSILNTQQNCIINKHTLNEKMMELINYINVCAFMPHAVAIDIANNYNDLQIFKCPDNEYINNIYVLSNESNTSFYMNKLPFISKIVAISIKSLSEMFNMDFTTKINLILYAINENKEMPFPKKSVINENHVNSADTTTFLHGAPINDIDSDIYEVYNIAKYPIIRIYRMEELIKVLIHEVIHVTRIDDSFGNCLTHSFNVQNIKYNNSKLLFNETITETLAEFINCVLYSEIYKLNFDEIINAEIEFGFIQTAKLLDHFDMETINNIIATNQNKLVFKQRTATFEYHILKSILLYKFDDFIYILITTPKKNKMNVANELIKKISNIMLTDKHYQNKINYYIKHIKSLPFQLKTTLRMSIVDIYDENLCSSNEFKRVINSQFGGVINEIFIDYAKEYFKYKSRYIERKTHLDN